MEKLIGFFLVILIIFSVCIKCNNTTKLHNDADFTGEQDILTGTYWDTATDPDVCMLVDKDEQGEYIATLNDEVYHMHIVGTTNELMFFEPTTRELFMCGKIYPDSQVTVIIIDDALFKKMNYPRGQ